MTDQAEHWLSQHALQYDQIDADGQNAILKFALVWSVLEGKTVPERDTLNPRRIIDSLDDICEEGINTLFDDAFSYFHQRYVEDTDHSMYALHLGNDYQQIVEDALLADEPGPKEKAKAVMLIVNRLRNNLLHGRKWDGSLGKQTENFQFAIGASISYFGLVEQVNHP